MVEREYLDQFQNWEVVRRLAKIPPARIEQLIKIHSRLLGFQENSDERNVIIDVGFEFRQEWQNQKSTVLKEDVPQMFDEVQECILRLLEITEGEECSLEILGRDPFKKAEGEYLRDIKLIKIYEEALSLPANTYGVVAHELGHHYVATILHSPYGNFQIFEEGYAQGVARATQKSLSGKYQRPIFHKLALVNTYENLITARGIQKILPEIKSPESKLERFGLALYISRNRHSLGDLLFAHLEAERGPDIYRQILHGEFKW